MRIGISRSAVALFWSQAQKEKSLQDLSYHLHDLYEQFFAALPNSPPDYASDTLRHIEKNYRLEDPQIVAARLIHHLTNGKATDLDPIVVAPFIEIVRLLARDVLLTVGNEVKKITR